MFLFGFIRAPLRFHNTRGAISSGLLHVWILACSYLDPCLFLFGSLFVLVWILVCYYLDPCLFLFGSVFVLV